MDKITKDRIAFLHPKIRDQVEQALLKIEAELPSGIQVRITQGLRTFAEQEALFSKGRTVPGKRVTNATGGQSIHNYGLALDFVLLVDGKVSWTVDENWRKVAEAFKAQGFSWGGEWKSLKDYPHLEKTFGHTWQQLLEKYQRKDFIEGTQYVKL